MSSRLSVDSSPQQSVDAALFREAMSHVASPVHLVTTDGPEGLGGYTCTAFASVSDTPPTVLVCLNRASRSAAAFRANGVFAVNVLGHADRALGEAFSSADRLRPVAERFTQGPWHKGASGAPLLAGALAVFDCRLEDLRDVGSHQVMTGRVVGVEVGQAGAPLFYHARRYRTFDTDR